MTTSAPTIGKQIAALRRMTPKELRIKYEEVYGERSHSGNRHFLIKRIAWRLQARAEGDLPERVRRRAIEMADDADLRLNPPRDGNQNIVARIGPNGSGPTPGMALTPGTILTRKYKGRLYQVTVMEDGFEYEGERYRSLSAVAKAITGAHWNGHLFFGLSREERAR